MNILDTIIAAKQIEVAERKKQRPLEQLLQAELFQRKTFSLKEFLIDQSRTGIIAEFKRRSPSKGIINDQADVVSVTNSYVANGASALSILTDESFFGGSTADLEAARIHHIPILRKDFIVDAYQIAEAKAMGADVILLIAACLTPKEVQDLASYAKSLHLEVLLELHDEAELEHICDETELVGINNRNLKTFEVDIERSLNMAKRISDSKLKIAESGIRSVDDVLMFKQQGFQGFLIGENFMKMPDPAIAFAEFVQALNSRT
ncbi:MAG: indole-3-glycerol phosphate synthase TrpC [Lacibacter sp.]